MTLTPHFAMAAGARASSAESRPSPQRRLTSLVIACVLAFMSIGLPVVLPPSTGLLPEAAAALTTANCNMGSMGINGATPSTVCWLQTGGWTKPAKGATATTTNLTATVGDFKFTYDVAVFYHANSSTQAGSAAGPTWASAAFGSASYGPSATTPTSYIYVTNTALGIVEAMTMRVSNVRVINTATNAVVPYGTWKLVFADAESTNSNSATTPNESIKFTASNAISNFAAGLTTDYMKGGGTTGTTLACPMPTWGGTTVTCTATSNNNGVIIGSTTPTSAADWGQIGVNTLNSKQAAAFGFSISSVQLKKSVASRVLPTDDFKVTIADSAGTTVGSASTGTTTSADTTAYAVVPGTYTLSETANSGSLSEYTQAWSCVDNAGFAAPAAPSGTSGTVTVQQGSAIVCTVTNTRKPVDLRLTKSSPAPALSPGVASAYTLNVTNNGGSTATNAVIVDQLPANIAYTSSSGTDWSCSASGTVAAGQLVTCTYTGLIAPSAAAPALTIAVTPADAAGGTTVTNKAAVTPTGGTTAPTAAVVQACTGSATPTTGCATSTSTVATKADIAVTKSDSTGSVDAGGTTTYTVTVTNNGPNAVSNVVVTDPAVSGLTKTTIACGAGCTTAPTKTQLEGAGYTISSLASGASFTFTVGVTVTATSGTVANAATATPPAGTIDAAGNNAATDTNTVTPVSDLAVTKTDNATTVDAGATTTYTVQVTNNGPSAVTGAILTDPAATGLTKTAVACGTGCATAPSIADLETGYALPTLASGASYAVQVTVHVDATSGSVTNVATVAPPAGTLDKVVTNDSAADTDTVAPVADVSVTKDDGVTQVNKNESHTYTITVHNAGPSTATGFVLTDPAATGLTKTAVACVTGCATAPTIAQLEGAGYVIPDLASGSDFVITVTATVTQSQGSVTNTAVATAPAGVKDPDTANNTGSDTDNLVPLADLTVTKTDGVAGAKPGDTVTYTVTVSNPSGLSTAANVVITDPAVAGLTVTAVACTSLAGNLCTTNPTISALQGAGVAIGTMSSGSTYEFTVTATVDATSGTVTNTATATTSTQDPNLANNSASDTDTVVGPPVISGPAEGSLINDNTPLITGTGIPGATVTVTEGGVTLCTAVVAPDGTWSCTSSQLTDGPHTISATQTTAGVTSTADTQTFTVDTTAPVVTATSPAVTNDTTPTISGTTDLPAGSTITVTEGGVAVCTATVAADGSWTCDPVTALPEGSHTFTASGTDAAGNTTTATTTTVIDVTAPVVTATSPAVTNDTTPTISGTTDLPAGSTITVTEGGVAVCTATVAADGSWTCDPVTALPEGSHTFTASGTDAAGNTTTATTTTVIDVTAPVVTATSPAVTNDTTPTISGTTDLPAGSTITVTEGGVAVCTATVAADGSWTCDPVTALPEGSHTFTASGTDAAGNTTTATTTTVIDVTAPVVTATSPAVTNDTTPTISGTTDLPAGSTITVTEGGVAVCTATVAADGSWTCDPVTALPEGSHTFTASGTDAAGNTTTATTTTVIDVTAPVVTATSPAVTNDTTPTISGTTDLPAGSTITVTEGGVAVCTATVAADGSWTCDPVTALPEGSHTFTASGTDAAGNTTTATTTTVIDVTAPVVTATSPAVTNDTTPTISGTTDLPAGSTITVTEGGVAVCTATVAADGSWTCDPVTALPEGSHTFTASGTDAAGNTTTATTTTVIDVTAPVVTATSPAVTNDTTPTISGTTDLPAGSTITVTEGGVAVCTATVAADGSWTCDPVTALPEGSHTFTASGTDAAGNTTTATTTTVIDVTAPVVTATSPAVTNDTTPTISGTTDLPAGSTITVTEGGVAVCTATVAADGSWTCDPVTALPEGSHTFTASGTDAAGNTTTATTTTVIDVTAPVVSLVIDPVTADNVVNAVEAGGPVLVTGTVSGEFVAGDTVTLTVNGNTYTGVVDAAGKFSIPVPGAELVADPDVTVDGSVSTVDAAGNPGSASDSQLYAVDVTAPVVSLVIDPVTADNVVNAVEAGGPVLVTGTVSGEFVAGDTVTLTVNGTTYTGVVDAAGKFSIPVPGAELVADPDVTVDGSVSTVDAAGNPGSASDSQLYAVDVTAPVVSLVIDPVTADNVVNAVEAGGPVLVTGTVSGEFVAGDTVTLTVNGTTYTGVVDAAGKFSIPVPGAELVADPDVTVDGSVSTVDAAGNPGSASDSQLYAVDVTAPVVSLVIDPVTADNVVNAVEAGGPVLVTGTVSGEFVAGDTVTLTVNGTTYTGVVDAAGKFSIPVPGAELVADPDVTVDGSVSTVDAAGNPGSASDSQLYAVDVTAPVVSLVIDPVTADNVVNAVEAGGPVLVTGTVSGEFVAGDTVTLTVNGNTYTGVVDAAGKFSIPVPGAELVADPDVTVDGSVSTVDAAGNPGSASDSQLYAVDVTAPVVSLVIDPVTADNVVNAVEAGGPVLVTGTVSGEFVAGDTVTLTVNGNTYTGVVDAAGKFSIPVPGAELVADPDVTVDGSVSTVDAAGNPGSASDSQLYAVDVTAPVVSLVIDPVTADNVVNAVEAGGPVLVTGTVSGEFVAGDTVTLTVNGTTYTGVVDAAGKFSIPVPGAELVADPDVTVDGSVSTVDAAGNPGSASDSQLYAVDVTAPVVSLVIDPVTADNVVNAVEAGGPVLVTGTVSGEFVAGDTVTLTVNGTTYTGVVDAAGKFSIPVPGAELVADPDVTVDGSVSTVDAAGNPGSASDSQLYAVDVTAPVVSLVIDPVTADNVVNAVEAGGPVLVTGTVSGEFVAGDTVTLTVNGTTYTGVVDAAGKFSIPVPGAELVADPDVTVDGSVSTVDAAGNPGSASDSQLYAVDVTAPVVSLVIDPVTADNVVNAVEAGGPVLVTGTVSGEFVAGDTVTLTVNGTTYTGVVDAAGKFSIPVPGAELVADPDVTVDGSVSTVDAAGNPGSASDSQLYAVDVTAPVVSLVIDPVTADNVVNAVEAGGPVSVTGTVSGEFVAGDTVTLTVNGTTYTGVVDAAGKFSIPVPGAELVADPDVTVDGSVSTVDAAGNPGSASDSQLYAVDVTAPVVSLVIDPVTADNVVNAVEAGGPVSVTGTVSGEFVAGDTVTLTVNGTTYTGVVDAAGKFSIPVPGAELVADPDVTVDGSVSTVDAAGNPGSASDSQLYAVDVTAPVVSLVIDPVTADNVVNAVEAGGPVSVTGTVSGEFVAGDTVTLTVNGTTYTGVVDAAGKFSIPVPGAELVADPDVTVDGSVSTVDAAGNPGSASDSQLYAVDVTAPVVSLVIDPVTADNVVNAVEAGGPVSVTGTVSGEFVAGDTVTLTVNGNTYTGVVDAAGKFSIPVPGAELVADPDVTVDGSVSTVDAAGNPGSASDSQLYAVDVTAPVVSLVIDPVTADNVVNAVEAGGPVSVTGTVSGEFVAGDTVTLTVNGNTYTGVVDAAGKFSIPVPGAELVADPDVTVDGSVSTVDAAGNPGSASDSQLYAVDVTAPVVSLVIDPVTADNVVNAVEAGGPVSVTGTVSGEFVAGDTVTLTVNGNTYTGVVDAAGKFSIPVPGAELVADPDVTVDGSVSTVDAAGNPGSASDSQLYAVDVTAPVVSLVIDPVTADNVVNAVEAGGPVSVTGTVSGEFVAGDTVTLTVNGTTYTGVVDAAGKFSIPVPGAELVADPDVTVDGSVSTVDAAGNPGSASDSQLYAVDVTAPVVSLVIDPVTADNVVNAVEAGGPVSVTGTVSGEFVAGDTVTLTVNGTTYTGVVDAAGKFSIPVPGAELVADPDVTVDGSVSTVDAAGNPGSASDSQLYAVDVTAPVVSLVIDPVTADNVVNAVEAGGPVSVTGTVSGEFVAGDTVTLTVNGNTYTGVVDAAGKFSIPVPGAELVADPDVTVDGSVSTVDAAGNPGSASDSQLYAVDVTAPVVSLVIDPVTADNVVNAVEAGGPVSVTGTVSGEFVAGDTVTLTVNGNTYTGVVDAAGKFSIPVPGAELVADPDVTVDGSVSTVDAAGNPGSASDSQLYAVDVTAPVVSLVIDPVTADNVVNAVEAGGPVSVTGTVSGEFVAGDTVTLTVNGTTYTGVVDAAGKFSIPVPGAELVADPDVTVDGSVSTVDAAGNPGSASDSQLYAVDVTAPVVSLVIDPVTADNVVNAVEAGGPVSVTGTVSGEFVAGDTVTLTVNGNTYTGVVDAAGKFSIPVPGAELVADPDVTVDGSVSTVDAAGNPGSASDSQLYAVDVTAPVVSLVIDPVTADNVVNAVEAGGPVSVTGTVSGEFVAGDTVTLTVNGNTYTGVVDAAGKFSIPVPGAELVADPDVTVDGSVSTVDAAGNPGSASDSQPYTVDVTAPVVSLVIDPVTADNVVNAVEAGGPVSVTGTVSGEFVAGDTVTLTVNGTTYTGVVDAAGKFSIPVPGAELVADPDVTVDGSVSTVDAAGNPGSASDSQPYTVDAGVTPPVITGPVDGSSTTNTTPPISGTGEPGATVTVTENGQPICTAMVAQDGTWSCTPTAPLAGGTHTFQATQTDLAGNVSARSNVVSVSIITAVIEGHVFLDGNANTTLDGGEADIAKVTVELVKDGVVVATQVTASPYRFTGVADGTYTIRVVNGPALAGLTATTEPDALKTVTMVNQVSIYEQNFGYVPAALPKTGSDVAPVLFSGLGLVTLGFVALLAVRRRHEDDEEVVARVGADEMN